MLTDLGFHIEVREALGEAGGRAVNTVPKGHAMYVPCPRCTALMARRRFGEAKLVVDVCRHHGVWFDAEELSAAIDFAQSQDEIDLDRLFWPGVVEEPRPQRRPPSFRDDPSLDLPRFVMEIISLLG